MATDIQVIVPQMTKVATEAREWFRKPNCPAL
jgi:hypothetical protein